VLRDLQQIDNPQKTRLSRQLWCDIREADRFDGIDFDLSVQALAMVVRTAQSGRLYAFIVRHFGAMRNTNSGKLGIPKSSPRDSGRVSRKGLVDMLPDGVRL